ncbi:MAG: nitroreductase family protein [Alphaproteobacteria bacterium]|nr:nitroreductase family protein [Alphaproteobacteria bacterium]
MNLMDAICTRRTYYDLSKESPITPQKITDLVALALKHTPSAFNMQSARCVVLFGKNHDQMWDTVAKVLKSIVPAKEFPKTAEKINLFKEAFGTVLFFEDEAVLTEFRRKFPLYEDRFQTWAEHGNAMLQINIWMLLEEAGLGASLQHYNPIIDDEIRSIWHWPRNWRLIAQMPFGTPVSEPDEKTFVPIKERLRILED